ALCSKCCSSKGIDNHFWSTGQDIQGPAVRSVLEVVFFGRGVVCPRTIPGISDCVELHAIFHRRKPAVSPDPVKSDVWRGSSAVPIFAEWIAVRLNPSAVQ